MKYALIHPDGHLAGLSDLDSPDDWNYPDGYILVQVDGQDIDFDRDLSDYLWSDGRFEVDPDRAAFVEPLAPHEAVKAIFAANPSLTVLIPVAIALRMLPYLPDYDADQTYVTGSLAIKDGRLQRKTITGWRIVDGG